MTEQEQLRMQKAVATYRDELQKRNPGMVSSVNALRAKLGMPISETGAQVYGVSNDAVRAAPAVMGAIQNGGNALAQAISGILSQKAQAQATPATAPAASVPSLPQSAVPYVAPRVRRVDAAPVNASAAPQVAQVAPDFQLQFGASSPARQNLNRLMLALGAPQSASATPQIPQSEPIPLKLTPIPPQQTLAGDIGDAFANVGKTLGINGLPSLPSIPSAKDIDSVLSYFSDSARKARNSL